MTQRVRSSRAKLTAGTRKQWAVESIIDWRSSGSEAAAAALLGGEKRPDSFQVRWEGGGKGWLHVSSFEGGYAAPMVQEFIKRKYLDEKPLAAAPPTKRKRAGDDTDDPSCSNKRSAPSTAEPFAASAAHPTAEPPAAIAADGAAAVVPQLPPVTSADRCLVYAGERPEAEAEQKPGEELSAASRTEVATPAAASAPAAFEAADESAVIARCLSSSTSCATIMLGDAPQGVLAVSPPCSSADHACGTDPPSWAM
jgi:hypothetical protein